MFDQLTAFGGKTTASVPVDVLDDGDAFVVTADMPGYSTDDIDVRLNDGRQLEISGEFERSESKESAEFVRSERTRQAVSRSVTLPEPVDEEATQASYDNGVLSVRLPKQTVEGEGSDIPVN